MAWTRGRRIVLPAGLVAVAKKKLINIYNIKSSDKF